jgi:Spy/CpxP family protein refolding chaperone
MNRTTLIAALAFTLSGSLTFAQQPQPQPSSAQATTAAPVHAPNPHRQAIRLSRELSLTPDQAAKLEPILAARDRQVAALRSNTALAPADLHKQMRAIAQATRQQFNSVLTPDQLQQLKSIQQSRRNKGQPNSPAPTA